MRPVDREFTVLFWILLLHIFRRTRTEQPADDGNNGVDMRRRAPLYFLWSLRQRDKAEHGMNPPHYFPYNWRGCRSKLASLVSRLCSVVCNERQSLTGPKQRLLTLLLVRGRILISEALLKIPGHTLGITHFHPS